MAIVFCTPLFSQVRHVLSDDPAGFAASLPQYMVSDPNLGKEDKEYLENALPRYLAFFDSLEPAVQEEVAGLASLAVKARVKPYPGLWDFLQTQKRMQEVHESEQTAWFEALRGMLKANRGRYFSELVSRTRDFLMEGLLYRSRSVCWRVSGADFRFHADPEPVFCFEKVDLLCQVLNDSSVIYDASGCFYPLKDRFDGQGGRLDWTRVGFSPDTCWADLLDYSLNLQHGRYESAALFHNLSLFPVALRGTVSERLASNQKTEDSRYPQFASEADKLDIRDLYSGVDVTGPFVQHGARVEFGLEGREACVTVRKGDRVQSRIHSDRIVLEKDRMTVPEARFVLYLEEDSLYNPMVFVRFENRERVMHVGNVENIGLEFPYIDTYHCLRMEMEALRWYLEEDRVDIGLLDVPDREGVVSFKSLDMYSREEIGHLMLGVSVSPVYTIRDMAKQAGANEFSLQDLASFIRNSKSQALSLIRELMAYGYVAYDPANEWVVLLPRFDHLLRVLARKADFDELEFVTTEPGIVKATMNLDSLVLKMSGVPAVLLSRKQNMYVKPEDSTVEIYKNRDFHFDGMLNAGVFNFDVRGGCFYYDDFRVDVADVQRLGLYVRKVEDGEVKERPVLAKFRYLAGKIYIDDPANKGGRLDFPQYPLMESSQPSYVYYDEPYVQGGAYKADSFYFRVDPFRLPDMNTMEIDSIRFPGTLVSGGILPDIRDELHVMPDYSLGFSQHSPQEGWSAYDDMALFTGRITLDNSGLWGAGCFDYRSSESSSDRMTFRPQDMDMQGTFLLSAGQGSGVEYPWMEGRGVDGFFERGNGTFKASSVKDSLLRIFNKDWRLQGSYVFSPSCSWAQGALRKQEEAQVSSGCFSVRTMGFASDSASFRLGASQGLCFLETSACSMDADLLAGDASFRSVTGSSPLDFGFHQYKGSLAFMFWDMDSMEVRMEHGNPTGLDFAEVAALPAEDLLVSEQPGEYFESTRRAQAGLGFNALSSRLDGKDTVLEFEGVCRLLVADAMLVPEGNALSVARTGLLRPLANARLYFGDTARLHAFHGVSAQVVTSRQYRASGLYDYQAPGMDLQEVYFAGIRPMEGGHSQAEAMVADSSVLFLNEAFQFIGKIKVDARQTYPFFSGSTRMVYACDFIGDRMEQDGYGSYEDEYESESGEGAYDDFEYEEYGDFEYVEDEGDAMAETEEEEDEESELLASGSPFLADGIQFSAYINPDSVWIPVDDQTRSTTGRWLGRGFYTSIRTREPELLFLQRKLTSDLPNVEVSGWLGFSRPERSYQIKDSVGRLLMEVNMNNCRAMAAGPIDLRMETAHLDIELYGKMFQDASNRQIGTDALTLFDFYLLPEVSGQIADLFNAEDRVEGMDIGPEDDVVLYVAENEDTLGLQGVREEISATGMFERIPKSLSQTLVFSDLKLDWDSDTRSFVSSGQAGLLSVAGHPVGKKLKTYMVLRKTRKGDEVDIYVEASRNVWMYFSYAHNYMLMLSSDDSFNRYIESLPGRKRKKGKYEFFLATPSKKNIFVRDFEEREGWQDQY